MRNSLYLAMAAAALIASPAVAQSTDRHDQTSTAMHQDSMARHDMSGDRDMHHRNMSMHRGMSQSAMMRWCHSMSHRRMMMNSRCRSMMHMHHWDRMHHM